MKYNGITWGPSMRGYLSDNKARIGRVESSLALLKTDGQFAREHRMLLEVFRDIDAVLVKHIELADKQAAETSLTSG
jgi:hypothetical protein